jgi:glycosyltransferase involved in cell wall biosynthesis
MSPRRVAYLYARYPSPTQPFCDTEMLALREAGAVVEVYSLAPPSSTFRHERLVERRIPVRYPSSAPILDAHERLARRRSSWSESAARELERWANVQSPRIVQQALALAAAFERQGIEHVHVHFAGRAALAAGVLKKIAGIPFSLTIHGLNLRPGSSKEALLRRVAGEAQLVVAVSDWSLERLRAALPEHAHKLRRVHNGIELGEFPALAAHGVRARPRVVSVGRLLRWKGFEVLVEACALLRRDGRDFDCVIVGEGPERPTLEAAIARHGLDEHVRLAGLCSQGRIRALLADSDVFVLASLVDRDQSSDVLPTVILEAMASGLPVVSTPVGGNAELVVEGETGSLVVPERPDLLARRLGDYLDSAELRRNHGRAGRARVEAHFDAKASARSLLRRFDEAFPPRGGARSPAAHDFAWFAATWPSPGAETPSDSRSKGTLRAPFFVGALAPEFSPDRAGEDLERAVELELLPDAGVLEALWLASPAARAAVDGLREQVDNRLRGESYFRDARRALWLLQELEFRGIRHVHVLGTASLLCGWLMKRLGALRVTFSTETRAKRRVDEALGRELDA